MRKTHNKNMMAFNNSWKIMVNDEIEDDIISVLQPYLDTEHFYDYAYSYDSMPLGRAIAFLTHFNIQVSDEEPLMFLSKHSSKDNEFREYGCVIGRKGIYYSKENPNNKKRKDKESALPGEDRFYPYSGIASIATSGKWITIYYIRPDKKIDKAKYIKISDDNERALITRVLNQIVSKEIGFAYFKGNVIDTIDDMPNAITRVFGTRENAINYYNYNNTVRNSEANITQNGMNVGVGAAGVQAAQPQFNAMYAENKNYMNGSRGHGYAAEYGNNAVDRFLFKNVENAAQNLENGHQVKNGPDRIVNGVEIQTKYYKTASESIGAAFEHREAVYKLSDGSERMMQIEVPRDQYQQALKLMQKRIDNGQVPNVKPGEDARNYVRKGYFTYEQSFLIAQSGTIESLTVDAMTGAVCCTQAAGVSAAIVFAMSLWSGVPLEQALKQSLTVGLKVLGKGTLIYTLTMQLSRDSFANYFAGKNMVNGVAQGFNTFRNPIFTASEKIASSISSSAFAKSGVGRALGLENIGAKQIIGGTITVAIVFGPDIARALTGRISTKQLFKNATVGAAGLAGAAIGQAIIPIPVVGAVIGGSISSYIAKKTLDHFVEDDAKIMFRILKEEFIDITVMSGLSSDELEKVIKMTVGHKDLSKQLQKMYQSQDFRNYAKDVIMKPAIDSVLEERTVISINSYDDGLKLLANEC